MSNACLALYRVALRALPGRLRDKHGEAMVAALRARLSGTPAWRHGGLTVAACLDALRRGLYERTRTPPPRAGGSPPLDPTTPGSRIMELFREVRHAARSLLRAPRFTAVAVVTLGLGIGATTAIFSVIEGVVLRPLPFDDPGRFAHVAMQGDTYKQGWLPYFRVDWMRRHADGLEAVSTFRSFTARLESGGRLEGRQGLRVDRGFFDVVGVHPALGRAFDEGELAPGGPAVAILSHAFWTSRFGGDPGVLGRTLEIAEEPHTVVGVMPRRFAMPYLDDPVDVITPLGVLPDPADEGANYPMIVRLADGVGPEAAQDGLDRAWRALGEAYPHLIEGRERGAALASYQELYVGDTRRVLWILGAAVAVVLGVACANVANLMLARGAQRRRDSVLRAALGAGRGRLLRLHVLEGLVVALAAAALGVGLAWLGVDLLLAMAPFELPRVGGVGVNGTALAFAMATGTLTGAVVGLVAGFAGTRGEIARGLQEGARGNSAGGRIRGALVAVQAALSVVLLVGAGMLLTSIANLYGIDTGFEPEGLLTVSFPVTPTGYSSWDEVEELGRRIEDGLRGAGRSAEVIPVSSLPLRRGMNIPVTVTGTEEAEGAVEWRAVDPAYREALGIPLAAGRWLDEGDREGAPPAVVVNQAYADRYFPDGDAVGGRIDIGYFRGRFLAPGLERPSRQIVGIVADVRDRALKEEPRRTVYVPLAQASDMFLRPPLFLVWAGPGAREIASVSSAVRDADPRLPEPEVGPLSDLYAESVAEDRFNAILLTAFATLALVLTAMGIYGVIAYSVRQRRREIGIRLALGAEGGRVTRMVAGRGMVPVLLGLLAGVGAAAVLSRYITALVWEVSPWDPRMMLGVTAVLVGVSWLASWLPAREATRVDPVRTLAAE